MADCRKLARVLVVIAAIWVGVQLIKDFHVMMYERRRERHRHHHHHHHDKKETKSCPCALKPVIAPTPLKPPVPPSPPVGMHPGSTEVFEAAWESSFQPDADRARQDFLISSV